VRVAFVGKGGSGKSTTVGTVARALAASGEATVVLDSDVMPGLAGAMGIAPSDTGIPADAVEEVPDGDGPRWRLRAGLTAEDAVERYALRGPDGVLLLQFGKLRTEGAWSLSPSLHAFDQIKRELPEQGWHVLGDLPGGTRQPFFGWADFASLVAVVVEPTVKSFVTARRLARLAATRPSARVVAVANKVEGRGDAERVGRETGLEVVGVVPDDPAVRDADRAGVALADHAPDSPAALALRSLAEHLREVAP
jgi:CO dehydrogenase maturation factor